jgi:ABC-type dipeptide/oligopeptide/nickel transport system permease component
MLRHALRRLLWTLPTMVGVTLIAFLFLSFVPDPTDDPLVVGSMSASQIEALRRQRFRDLPRLVNTAPRDVRVRALQAMAEVAQEGPGAMEAARELARLGGAALPHVVPSLDALAPEPRARVALALAPIAQRMGLTDVEQAYNPGRVVAFWARFWADRGVEFRAAGVRSAVQRLARYGSVSRAAELRELDTYALEHVFAALEVPFDTASVERARALVDIIAHVTDSYDRIRPGEGVETARACVERWHDFWFVYRSDFVVFAGPARVAAMGTETRYGKWALSAVTMRLGKGSDGVPVAGELARRAPVTLALVFGAITLAYALAVPLGALAAASRGRRTDLLIACGVLGLYAVPTAVFAVVLARMAGQGAGRMVVGVLVLALALVAAPTRQQRSALVYALSQDYVRAALARGAGRTRAVLVHGLRNALLPVATLATLEPPMALGGAFVVERVFGLAGLGEATIRAVQTRDTAWLMALAIIAAGFAAVGVIATDLACVVIDPRLGGHVLDRKRGAS